MFQPVLVLMCACRAVLFWFQKVVSQSADVMTDVRNYLDLTGCLVRRIPHATPLFELSIEPPAHAHLKTYVLRADSEAELLAWLAVLQGASAPRAVVASTWARANKRRAFVVLDSQLRIFNDDERKDLRACVDVEDVQTLSATSINVVAGAQRIELVFGDAHECEDWQAKLTEAVRAVLCCVLVDRSTVTSVSGVEVKVAAVSDDSQARQVAQRVASEAEHASRHVERNRECGTDEWSCGGP
jgi:hypothetical protein